MRDRLADCQGETETQRVEAPASSQDRLASEALRLLGDTYYEWTLGTDRLVWAPHAAALLGVGDPSRIATGRGYTGCLAFRNGTNQEINRHVDRHGAIHAGKGLDAGEGVSYCVEYLFARDDGETCWIEDRGRWFADESGAPARAVGIVRVVTDRRAREDELAYLSSYDPLTGLLNRGRLTIILDEMIARCGEERLSGAYVVAAIDNLGIVNSNYGFSVADEVIVELSARLQRQLPAGDVMGRSAGNKFGIVFENCTARQMKETMRRLLACVRDEVVQTKIGPVSVTISIGGVMLPDGAHSAQQAMARAEEVLSDIKQNARDVCAVFEPSAERDLRRQFNIEIADQLISALNDRRIRIAFQPIVSAHTREPVMYESLLRMEKPDGSILPAQFFIPIAEQLGFIRMLDHRALELVLRTLADYPKTRLTLNVSGHTTSDTVWLETLVAGLRGARSIAERLTIEITETVAIHDIEEMASFVSMVRNLGCKVAIDDFGAGYTSFRNLKMLGVDLVKLDGSFVKDISRNPANFLFVRNFVDLARNFSIPTVAEWVSDAEDAALLQELGVEYFQGYHFGEPAIYPPWLREGDRAQLAVNANQITG